MTLQPGQEGTFTAGNNVPSIRIQTSGPNGETNANQALFEDNITPNPLNPSQIVHSPDVSDVAGTVGYDGKPQSIEFTDGTKSAGDGTTAGIYPLNQPNADNNPNSATNPMNMALDPATTYTVTFS